MSFKVSFLDNQVCGVDDFNAIVSDIMTGGVVTNDFDNTSEYQMSKMNVVTKTGVSQGVSAKETSLACTVGAGGVYVAPGLGVFGSGAKIKVTESEFVECNDVENAYVYAYHDVINNVAGIKSASDGFPAETEAGFYVLPLCQIEGGIFTDKREYAKSNVIKACDTVNTVKKMVLTVPNKDYDGQDIVVLTASDKTRLNFLLFLTIEGVYIVEETNYGEFRIIYSLTSSSAESLKILGNVILWEGTGTNYTYLKDFKRDATGNICAEVNSGLLSSSYEYILYASVYEEVSE